MTEFECFVHNFNLTQNFDLVSMTEETLPNGNKVRRAEWKCITTGMEWMRFYAVEFGGKVIKSTNYLRA